MTIVGWSPDAASAVRASLDEVRGELERAQARLRTRTWPNAAALSTQDAAVVAGVQALADDAELACGLARADVDRLGVAVELAGWTYQTTEAVVRGSVDWAADTLAVGLGVATRGFVTAAVGGIGIAAIGASLLWAPLVALAVRNPHLLTMAGTALDAAGRLAAPLLQGLQSLAQRHGPDLLNSPAFVDAIALAISQLDDVGAGFALLRASPIGDDESLSAAATSAMLLGLLLTGRPPRLPGSVPVTIQRTHVPDVDRQTPVASYAEAFDRVQAMQAPIEIDRYVLADGTVVWQVFAGGTESFDLDATDTAYDMTSNIENATNVEGGATNGSAAAVLEAMESVGIADGDVVQLVGYSQGGAAVAGAALGASVRIDSVVTFGAPVGTTAVPEGTTTVAVQNDSDIVAALGGMHGDERLVLEGSPDLGAIETDRYDPAGQPLAEVAAGGHHPEAYADTAARLDALDDTVVDAVWDPVADVRVQQGGAQTAGWDVER